MTPKRTLWREKIWMGYSFGEDRESTFLLMINYVIVILFFLIVIILYTHGEELEPITYRYHSLVLIGLLNLWLLWKKKVNAVRVIILVSFPVALLILPRLGGIQSDEFYFWFPYIPLGMSVIPHFILEPVRQRVVLFLTLGCYLLLGIFMDDYLIVTSDGSESIVPIVEANRFYYKLVPAILFVFVNATLRILFVLNHRYREIMQNQQEVLIQGEKMSSLGILTGGLAHEINNPLNFISSSLNALKTLMAEYFHPDEDRVKQREELMQQMEKVSGKAFEGVERATDIIRKLEFFSNPGVQQERNEIHLQSLVNMALRSIESSLPYYVRIESDIPGELKIMGNEPKIRLVIIHILRNAIDAMESASEKRPETIRIIATRKSRERKPYVMISMLNSGPPIPEKDLKHIFDPFFSSRDPGDGVGLGMSLSYMIIRQHGGIMEIGNQEDMVRVDIYLPAWAETV